MSQPIPFDPRMITPDTAGTAPASAGASSYPFPAAPWPYPPAADAAANSPAPQPEPAAPEPAVPAAATDMPAADLGTELGVLAPKPTVITLTSGTRVRIKKLKTRGLLSLLAVGLVGIGSQLSSLQLDPDDDPGMFMGKFLGLVVAALPHAQDEVIDFLRTVCEPDAKVTGFKIGKEQRQANQELDAALTAELEDPEPDDTFTIIETIIVNNAGDLQTWGKRLAGVYRLARKTGQTPPSPTSPVSSTSAA